MAGRLSRSDAASTSAIGFLVAAMTIGIAFGTASVMVEQGDSPDPRGRALDAVATTALEVIVSDGGHASGGYLWVEEPDHLTRFGLAKDGQENFLDYRKIKSMRNASLLHATNDAPDYADVRAALGIESGDFHLRTYPVLPGFDDPRWSKDPRGRLAYVGHYGTAAGAATVTPGATTSAGFLNVSVAIRNDGLEPQIFVVGISIGNSAANDVIATEDRHTELLASGETQTVWARFPPMAYSPALTAYKVDAADSHGKIIVEGAWRAATAPSGTTVAWAPLISAGDVYYQSGESVKFLADHFEGDGTRINSNPGQSARFVLFGPDGAERVNTSVTLPKNGVYTHTCTTCTTSGVYRGVIWDAAVTRNATDHVEVSPVELFLETETMGAIGVREIGILSGLVTSFSPTPYHKTTNTQGDIFADSTHIRDLDDVLSRYTTLVVGSEVKQNALNAGQTKWAIADWVQAGGNLIVLGTDESQSRWLEPVYHAAQDTANGGISAPDATHPVLSAPNPMDFQRYLDNGRAWKIKSDEPFTHVLTRGTAGDSSQDTLALANPGAYNEGTVVLSSYMAGALTSPQDDTEAKRFLHNLLSQSYNMLFLDYGPPIPDGVPVGSAQRLVAVPHPNVPDAVVEVKIVMYTWS